MPAQDTLYQEVLDHIYMLTRKLGVRNTSIKRLGLLVLGIICSESCVIAKMAARLCAMGVTDASAPSVRRRLRRTLHDEKLEATLFYEPAVRQAIDWQALLKGSKRVFLIVDESSKEEQIQLLRVSLAYRGSSVPLAWAIWYKREAQGDGAYWANVDAVLNRVQKMIPAGLTVIVIADRAYDNPPFVDRIAARGWHWLVRVKMGGTVRFLDRHRREHVLGEVIRRHVKAPGMQWRTRGSVFKKAGWRRASIVVTWGVGQREPLAVISDMRAEWRLLEWYRRRFWTEPGFRNDKKRGWNWEDAQVRGLVQHQRLLLGMAWATLIAMCLGVEEADARQQRLAASRARAETEGRAAAKREHPRESLFTMGLRRAYYRLYGNAQGALRWLLPNVNAESWCSTWREGPHPYVLKTVPP